MLGKGTFVNDTHWQYTAKCTGCTSWGDDDIGYTTLDATAQNALAFAYSQSPPDEPDNTDSTFTIHDSVGHWYHDFGNIGNADFDDLVSKNSEGPATSAAGGSTGTPSTTTPEPTSTTDSSSTSLITPTPTTADTSEAATPEPTSTTTSTTAPETSTPAADPLPFPSSCSGVSAVKYPQVIADGWKMTKIAGGLTVPRTVIFDSAGNMLVLESNKGISVHTFGPDGCLNSSNTVLANTALNHGLTLSPDSKQLYASSMTTAWRWDWDPETRQLGSDRTVIITGMNNGGHQTRSVYIPPNHPNLILASVGSNDNWDYDSESMAAGRAAVKAFDMDKLPAAGFVYATDGYQFGYGLRNEVGLVFDPSNKVWGVENGGDVSSRPCFSPGIFM